MEDIAIAHRIGPVDIGHISLVVAVASPHRKEAFFACHEAVNRLKHIRPHLEKGSIRGRRALGCLRGPRIPLRKRGIEAGSEAANRLPAGND